MEMLGAGLPILSSGTGGNKEHSINNNLIFYHDKTSFLNKLIHLLNNYEEDGKNLSKLARRTANEIFTKKVYFKKINSFFNKIFE